MSKKQRPQDYRFIGIDPNASQFDEQLIEKLLEAVGLPIVTSNVSLLNALNTVGMVASRYAQSEVEPTEAQVRKELQALAKAAQKLTELLGTSYTPSHWASFSDDDDDIVPHGSVEVGSPETTDFRAAKLAESELEIVPSSLDFSNDADLHSTAIELMRSLPRLRASHTVGISDIMLSKLEPVITKELSLPSGDCQSAEEWLSTFAEKALWLSGAAAMASKDGMLSEDGGRGSRDRETVNHLLEIFEEHFDRKAGVSTNPYTAMRGGPTMRFLRFTLGQVRDGKHVPSDGNLRMLIGKYQLVRATRGEKSF